MLMYFPFRIVDRSKVSTVDDFDPEEPYIVFRGVIRDLHTISTGRTSRIEATFFDGTGEMTLTWFQGLKWIKDRLKAGVVYLVMGKPALYNGTLQMVHPDIEAASIDEDRGNHKFLPVYHTTEKAKNKGITTKYLARLTDQALRLSLLKWL